MNETHEGIGELAFVGNWIEACYSTTVLVVKYLEVVILF